MFLLICVFLDEGLRTEAGALPRGLPAKGRPQAEGITSVDGKTMWTLMNSFTQRSTHAVRGVNDGSGRLIEVPGCKGALEGQSKASQRQQLPNLVGLDRRQ